MPDVVDALFLSFQTALAGRYSLERELGRGGMGVVYLAREVRLDRAVAIKLLPPEFAVHENLRDRFLREARTAARLSHPYVVPIHSVDEIGDFVFYVMAYVDGETLAQRVASRGPVAPTEATRILREVAWALAYAHAQGVVHRDVKPANILLERGTERAMVTDFGIARQADTAGQTAIGEILGTPEYMSPEQATGEPLDGRSDLYSLGVVGFYMLAGQLPFVAGSAQAVLAQHITKPAPPVASVARATPATLARAIDQCLEKNPASRPVTGEALADLLAPALEKRAEVPIPVRVFIDRRRAVFMILPPIMISSLSIDVFIELARHGSSPAFTMVAALGLAVLAIGAPIAILLTRLRSVLKLGYGSEDIAAAIRTGYLRHREEFQYEFGTTPSVRERALRVAGVAGIASSALMGVAIAVGALKPIAVPFAILALYGGAIAAILSSKWARLRKGSGSRIAKFWDGRIGRRLASIAGFKLGARAIPANRPTELAISMSAEALYESFSKELRGSLGDVPAALHALEAHARAARAHIAEIDATIDQAQHGPARAVATDGRQETLIADLRASRTAAEARLAEVVTALENVRLDLLRLHAGVGSVDSITQDLAAARTLGAGAQRLLAGVREVDEVLKR